MKPMRLSMAHLAGLALLVAPRIAAACSSCFQGRSDETRVAFIATTVFLTALPLVLIGSVAWWLRRRSLRIEAAVPAEGAGTPSRATGG